MFNSNQVPLAHYLGWLVLSTIVVSGLSSCTGSESDEARAVTSSSKSTTIGSIPQTTQRELANDTESTSDPDAGDTPFSVEDSYSMIIVDPSQVSLVWRDGTGTPLGQLERARRQVEQTGATVVAVLNAGIYTPAQAPAGLHIENGVELAPINLNEGEGNFHLLPNGVFSIDDNNADVSESRAFDESRNRQGLTPDLAVQSGPMLVIDREIHPVFSPTSESRNFRNGVGVTEDGQVLFLNSNEAVTFWQFANEFLDRGAVNALYLDGKISRMEPVTVGQPVPLNIPFAAMLVITE